MVHRLGSILVVVCLAIFVVCFAAPAKAFAGAQIGAPQPDESARAAMILSGSFISSPESSADGVVVVLHTAPVTVEGLENTLYFEFARADDPANPFRQGVFHFINTHAKQRMRVLDFTIDGSRAMPSAVRESVDMPGLFAGLWAAPDVMPTLTPDMLSVNVELVKNEVMTNMGGAIGMATQGPWPTTRDGAVEMVSEFIFSDGHVSIADRGFDASGRQLWGPEAGQRTRFTRFEPPIRVQRYESGTVKIVTSPSADADAAVLASGGRIWVRYSGFLLDGFMFNSNRNPAGTPLESDIPGRLIGGWNLAMPGVREGERVKLILVPTDAYGEAGAPRGNIPPNAVLVFDIDVLGVRNQQPLADPAANAASDVPADLD